MEEKTIVDGRPSNPNPPMTTIVIGDLYWITGWDGRTTKIPKTHA